MSDHTRPQDYHDDSKINVAQAYPDVFDYQWELIAGHELPEFLFKRTCGGSCKHADGTIHHKTATSWCCNARRLQKKKVPLDPRTLRVRLPNPKLKPYAS